MTNSKCGSMVVCVALAVASMTSSSVATAQAVSERAAVQRYEIAAGPLDAALKSFAKSAGVLLAYRPELVQSRRTAGLSGEYSAEQALIRLLADSDLETVATADANYTLRKKLSSAAPTVMRSVRVEADAEPAATSEGTRSYAARAASIGKTEQRLREIPQSVSVLTRQQLDDQNLVTLDDAMDEVVGVHALTFGSNWGDRYLARGAPLEAQYDGVPGFNSLNTTASFDTAIYDRIEVLRGPSGLLQGSGEPSGVVNLVRKRPLDRFGMNGSVGIGSWNNFRGDVDVSGPFNEAGSLRGRGVISARDRDYFYDLSHEKVQLAYGIVEYELTDSTAVALSGAFQNREVENPFDGLPTYNDGTYLPVPRSTFAGLHPGGFEDELSEGVLDVTRDFANGWRLQATVRDRLLKSARTNGQAMTGVDRDTGLIQFLVGGRDSRARVENQGVDVHASGSVEWLGRQHDLLLGYNWDRATNAGTYGLEFVDVASIAPSIDASDWSTPTVGYASETRQSGFYGMARLKVLEPLTVLIGGRLTDYLNRTRDIAPSAPSSWRDGAEADEEFTPYGGVLWDFTSNLTWYASYAEIFVPQTETDVHGGVLDPRVGWQGETGVKGEFFAGALNASMAFFRIRDTNRALIDLSNAGCGTPPGSCYVAAGLIESEGFEAEISGSPLEGLQLSAGFTRNEPKYRRDSSPENVGQPVTAYLPRDLFKLWAHYDLPGGANAVHAWSVGTGLRAQSRIVSVDGPGIELAQGGYAVASAQVGYRFSDLLQATLTVDNLFDRSYYERVGGVARINYFGEPRSFMLSLRYQPSYRD